MIADVITSVAFAVLVIGAGVLFALGAIFLTEFVTWDGDPRTRGF